MPCPYCASFDPLPLHSSLVCTPSPQSSSQPFSLSIHLPRLSVLLPHYHIFVPCRRNLLFSLPLKYLQYLSLLLYPLFIQPLLPSCCRILAGEMEKKPATNFEFRILQCFVNFTLDKQQLLVSSILQ